MEPINNTTNTTEIVPVSANTTVASTTTTNSTVSTPSSSSGTKTVIVVLAILVLIGLIAFAVYALIDLMGNNGSNNVIITQTSSSSNSTPEAVIVSQTSNVVVDYYDEDYEPQQYLFAFEPLKLKAEITGDGGFMLTDTNLGVNVRINMQPEAGSVALDTADGLVKVVNASHQIDTFRYEIEPGIYQYGTELDLAPTAESCMGETANACLRADALVVQDLSAILTISCFATNEDNSLTVAQLALCDQVVTNLSVEKVD